MLIDPRVIARLCTVLSQPLESRTRIFVESPALGAMIAGRLRPVERTFALAPIKTAQVTARQRHPHDALAVDVAAARPETRQRYIVDFCERGLRRIASGNKPHDCTRIAPESTPNRAVHRIWHNSVETSNDAFVFGWIHRLIRLYVLVALAVAVGVEDKRCPALRFCDITCFVEHLGIDPADRCPAAAGPQSIVGVVGELQMMRPEASIDKRVLRRLGIEYRKLSVRPL